MNGPHIIENAADLSHKIDMAWLNLQFKFMENQ